MGASQSSNVAQATSNVANSIKNSTAVNSYQVNTNTNSVTIRNCNIKLSGDFDVAVSQDLTIQSNQIANVKSSTGLNNNIQQSVLQNAISKVGSLGVGYASAVNNTSLFCNITSNVINNVSEASTQFSQNANSFTCDGGTIVADNMVIGFSSVQGFYNDQVLDNSNVTDITNDITQTVTQKASATVQGLSGFLMALAFVIAAFGYAIAKPLTTGPFKILMVVLIMLVIAGVAVWMYLIKAPPFFNDDITCCPSSNLGNCNDSCVDQKLDEFIVKGPPIRYYFPLTTDTSPPEGIPPGVSLTGMVISAASGIAANNGGYTMLAYTNIQEKINELTTILNAITGLPQYITDAMKPTIPNPLENPSDDSKKMIKIPWQFILESGSENEQLPGSCTPSTIKYNNTASTSEGTDASQWDFNNQSGSGAFCPTSAHWTKIGRSPDGPTESAVIDNVDFSNLGIAVANPNTEYNEWAKANPMFARFVLTYIINSFMEAKIDLNVYNDPDELVLFVDPVKGPIYSTVTLGNAEKYCQKFVLHNGIPVDQRTGTISSGTITAMMGVCNSQAYKFHQFSRHVGVWILLALVLFVIGFILYPRSKTVSPKA